MDEDDDSADFMKQGPVAKKESQGSNFLCVDFLGDNVQSIADNN